MTRPGEGVQRGGFLALRSAFDGSSVTKGSLPSFPNPISSLDSPFSIGDGRGCFYGQHIQARDLLHHLAGDALQ
ncbi:hypothetical protein, partial [Mesorhizobium sp. M4B.F.Ca.ET.089.01.1.1]|uniref:hypothetical protein n=1 Tax=Mesorhizobium sp. M4B.F.Ca.ET.089.01.1.1 TaxID=2496662 RepID=UPI001AEC73A9